MTRHTPSTLLRLGAALVAVPALLAACTGGGGTAASALPTIPPATEAPSGGASASPDHPGPTFPPDCPREQPEALGADDVRLVTLTTSKGDIVIEVKGSLSPIATGNFVTLADCGYYDNVVFHRVVPNFVIQGGDGQFGRVPLVIPELVGTGGPPYTIQDEPITTKYSRGTVAMARTAEPNSVGSQFFIVLSDEARAPLESYNTYQIIGTVTSGMETVDAIAADADQELPTNPIAMESVTVTTP
ncbi:MAG TPA: peptidylprolyl isomerase [Candidatus Limnocylindrales bacterium]|nr:peptidylprolyl isomerase [Candidatus Limnocylindrales bacterium]